MIAVSSHLPERAKTNYPYSRLKKRFIRPQNKGIIVTISAEAQASLGFIQKECQKLETRISAYERKAYNEVFESMNPIGAQLAVENLADELDAEIAAELKKCDEHLDDLNDRLNEVEGVLGEAIRLLSAERDNKAREYNEKRKSVNAGNVAKGFWSIYGGVFFGAVFAFAARGAGLGVIGCVVAGVLGYAGGSYVLRYLSQNLAKKRIDPVAQAAAEAELNEIHEEYKNLTNQMNALQDNLIDVSKSEDLISELQDFVQDTLDGFEE